jgi:hypothetical protein
MQKEGLLTDITFAPVSFHWTVPLNDKNPLKLFQVTQAKEELKLSLQIPLFLYISNVMYRYRVRGAVACSGNYFITRKRSDITVGIPLSDATD